MFHCTIMLTQSFHLSMNLSDFMKALFDKASGISDIENDKRIKY